MNRQRSCFPFVGDSVGGSQISAVMLIMALDRARYEPLVILHEPGPLTGYLEDQKIDFEILPLGAYVGPGPGRLSHLRHILITTPVLYRFLRRHTISIVHAQDGRMNQTCGMPARLSGASFICHQRSKYAPSGLTQLAMRLADGIACNSQFVRDGLPSSARAKATVIANPFDTDIAQPARHKARAAALQALDLSSDGRIVSFVGNLTTQKRPEVFLRAAALIRDGIETPVRFLIFGRDREDLKPQLSALSDELSMADDLQFMGFHDPIAPWLAASDMLLVPEVDDAFGRSLVEAMLVGTPVVASDSGGHREIIEHEKTGLLSPPDDPMAMASAALTLLLDRGRSAEIAARGREAALARYAIPAHAVAMMELYDQVG